MKNSDRGLYVLFLFIILLVLSIGKLGFGGTSPSCKRSESYYKRASPSSARIAKANANTAPIAPGKKSSNRKPKISFAPTVLRTVVNEDAPIGGPDYILEQKTESLCLKPKKLSEKDR